MKNNHFVAGQNSKTVNLGRKNKKPFSKAQLFIIVPPESPRTSENHLGMPFQRALCGI